MESLDIQDIQEIIQEEKTPLEKAKKPRSDKQMENFKKLQEKRKEAIEKKKLEKKIEASKLLLELEQMTTSPPVIPKNVKQVSPLSEEEEESDSSAEKIIVNVKNKKKAKKKAKEIIIYKDDDSDTEEEEEEEQEYKQPKRALKTQQNKKSKTKIYQQERERPLTETGGLQPQIFKSQSMNYFVD